MSPSLGHVTLSDNSEAVADKSRVRWISAFGRSTTGPLRSMPNPNRRRSGFAGREVAPASEVAQLCAQRSPLCRKLLHRLSLLQGQVLQDIDFTRDCEFGMSLAFLAVGDEERSSIRICPHRKENPLKFHGIRWGLFAALLVGTAGMAYADAFVGVLPVTPGGSDYQAYYDSTTNMTWLADATVNNFMTWSQANTWAAGLDINGVTGWTLPTTNQVDSTCAGQVAISSSLTIGYGTGCVGSPMGHLFYDVLGGTPGNTVSNDGPFYNIQPTGYWSSTPLSIAPGEAWAFSFFDGSQLPYQQSLALYAWAVHAGETGVAQTTTASEPGVISLMLAGLVLVGFAARRRLKHG